MCCGKTHRVGAKGVALPLPGGPLRNRVRLGPGRRGVSGQLTRVLTLGWLMVTLATSAIVIAYTVNGGPAAEITDRAQVASTLLAAVLIVPPAVVWAVKRIGPVDSSPPAPTDLLAAAHYIASQTSARWKRELIERGIQSPAPVRVRWQWSSGEHITPVEELRNSGALPSDPLPLPTAARGSDAGEVLDSGRVTELHDEVYARLQHGRLLLVGEAGAGKTGAMILLLVEALRSREQLSDSLKARVPVPLWLTLGTWMPDKQGFREWVIDVACRDFAQLGSAATGRSIVEQLFDSGRLALFLDGFDEMPEPARKKAIDRIGLEAGGLRLVITSRPLELFEASRGKARLDYVAVVDLLPVRAREAAQYLLAEQRGEMRLAWEDVSDKLSSNPDGALARTLNNPLMLTLARLAYKEADPRGLLAYEEAEVGEHKPGLYGFNLPTGDRRGLRLHLLDQVLVAAYPDSRERAYAHYWLGRLARSMGDSRQLKWWEIGLWLPETPTWISRLPRFRSLKWSLPRPVRDFLERHPKFIASLKLIAAILLGGVLVYLVLKDSGRLPWLPFEEIRRLLRPEYLIPFATLYLAISGHAKPSRIISRRPRFRDLATLWRHDHDVSGYAVAALLLLLATLPPESSLESVSTAEFVIGALAAALMILLYWLTSIVWRLEVSAEPRATPLFSYRCDRRSVRIMFAIGAAVGLLLGGLEGGFALGRTDIADRGLSVAIEHGIVAALVFGVGIGFWYGPSTPLRSKEMLLSLFGRPVRFLPLLERALEKQVLRQNGLTYEFRHAELQDRLGDQLAPWSGSAPRCPTA